MALITLEDLKTDPEVKALIKYADKHLYASGYTDHGFRHLELVARRAKDILLCLNYSERIGELAAIAGYLHDIGNVVGRYNHSQSGALIAHRILNRLEMKYEEIAIIMGAIGNHDETEGQVVNQVAAALILADKSDVQRSRVRNKDFATFDIHDRVNYAVMESDIKVTAEERTVTLNLIIDMEISSVIEYFEIFLTRMILCRRAASFLDCQLKIFINNSPIL